MSVLVESRPRTAPGGQLRAPRLLPAAASLLWPLLASAANALAFLVVRPNVGDLQAALARQLAAASGVGLTYWFPWYGGGAAPGSYSVITPTLSALIGAPTIGVIAAIAITPLAWHALAGTPHQLAGTWAAVFTSGMNIWAGRIPFALGAAVAVAGAIALRRRRTAPAVAATVLSSLCSPVTGAFLAFGAAAATLVERDFRRIGLWVAGSCAATFVVIALFFGNPGPQGFAVASGFLTAGTALAMLLARPAASVRAVLWCAAAAAIVLTLFPNGMGSNFTRLPWLCLPAAVVATATASRRFVILGVLPALALCANATIVDLVRSSQPSAAASYYRPLIHRLDQQPDIANYRVEVVTNPVIHTAAYALLGHAALAGGYETQEQNEFNPLLSDPKRLNAHTYQHWLESNAVGFVAFDRKAINTSAEYQLVQHTKLPYLQAVSRGPNWLLYRVAHPAPIVPPPAHLLKATQALLRVRVPCACTVPIRIRYSKFLDALQPNSAVDGVVADDGTGWTVLTTPRPGIYVLGGDLARPLH